MLLKPIQKCGVYSHVYRRLFSQAIASSDSEILHAPSSAHSVSTGHATGAGNGGVSIRQVGCTRRVFFLKSHLSMEEIEGLAYRIRVLSQNTAINSVLMSRGDDTLDTGLLPTSVLEAPIDTSYDDGIIATMEGYDPVELYKSGLHEDEASLQRLFDAVGSLSTAVRGDKSSRVPILTLPSGLVCDSAYAICMGGYVLATNDTSFRIVNPSRGLSLDPIGLSFILPRLGWEYQQTSADYVGCGMILALTGMEANVFDMMETGLATHYIESDTKLGHLEACLAELPPWEQQGLKNPPPRFYGQPEREEDVNAAYRNAPVRNLIYCFSSYDNASNNPFTNFDVDSIIKDDPSTNLDYISMEEHRKSHLLHYAKTFDSIFREEKTVVGIVERLKERANRDSIEEKAKEEIAIAKELVQRMEQQSPLAISVIYKLMQTGARKEQSIASCMEREKRSQTKLCQMDDFRKWAEHKTSSRGSDDIFSDWKYKTLDEVPAEEVNEIIGS